MVVDDESDLLNVTTKMLQQNGYEVHAFQKPEDALNHIKIDGCKDCSLIISDIRMPELSGFELARKIREINADAKIILMTAFMITKQEAELILPCTKVDGFLNKPFRTADLLQVVKECAKDS